MHKKITKPLTLSGRYFSKKDLILVQQTVESFPNLSRTELAETLCEHLNWRTARDGNKVNTCLLALEKLEKLGIVSPPPKLQRKKREPKAVVWSADSAPQPPVACHLDALGDIRLEIVTEKTEVALWKEYVDRYHYLGYRHPIGASLKYFIVYGAADRERKILGCLLFSGSVWQLADRDQWIGWEKTDREKRLNLIINNNRFLIFPWVEVPNLASHVLSRVTRQICDDWNNIYGYRPVLIETFVDTERYSGTCYQAANWECIGESSGKDWKDESEDGKASIKSIYLYPLQSNFRAVLKNLKPAKEEIVIDEDFITLWGKVVGIISDIAQVFDAQWQTRKRAIDSLLLVFLIFRLVFSKNSQGYGTTISEFWHNCHRMKFPLPQKQPIAASSFTVARKKLDEAIFSVLNRQIIEVCDEDEDNERDYRWFNHRLFAVDGSKLNLPRKLLDAGYKVPSDNAHYPQGLLSCLFQLKSKIPYDFDLTSHANERVSALAHLNTLRTGDVVVYDRGYFSYVMLYYHLQHGVHPIFRIKRNSFKAIDAFINGSQTDQIIPLMPSKSTQLNIKKEHPAIEFTPLTIRLIKYTVAGNSYCIGTTLVDNRYTIDDFMDVYHARWGVEELYKVSKQMIEVDDFHGQCERTVKQELFAHFVLITMSRLCSNESENLLKTLLNQSQDVTGDESSIQVNYKNTLTTVSRYLEDIMFAPARCIKSVMEDVVNSISRNRQKVRPGRSYVRRSRKPLGKWLPSKTSAKT